MLEVDDIHTYYGDSHVLQGVTLRVNQGQIVVLLGRNGAGKSTAIRSIIGLDPPRRGRIIFCGTEITHMPSHSIARLGVGLVPQGRSIFAMLTVRENITLAARDANQGGWILERVLQSFPNLSDRLGHRGSQISGGEQQMLAFARVLMTNPLLLLLDEPSEGLDPLMVAEIKRTIVSLREQGISILLVEQNLSLALSIADYAYVMSKGRITFKGTPKDLSDNIQIMHRYLGI